MASQAAALDIAQIAEHGNENSADQREDGKLERVVFDAGQLRHNGGSGGIEHVGAEILDQAENEHHKHDAFLLLGGKFIDCENCFHAVKAPFYLC